MTEPTTSDRMNRKSLVVMAVVALIAVILLLIGINLAVAIALGSPKIAAAGSVVVTAVLVALSVYRGHWTTS